jgi:glycosyltransferase involved in cell wall biosynthesis
MQPTVDVSVVVPCYQAAGTIQLLCEGVTTQLVRMGVTHELVLVDDGSTDATWPAIQRATEAFPGVIGIRLSRNFGQHYALTAGVAITAGASVVTMDCDLQDRPEDIPLLLAEARAGHDVVLARRRGGDSRLQGLVGRMFYRMFAWLTGYAMDPSVGTFRVMSRRVVDPFNAMTERYRLFGGMIHWLGFSPAFVDVQRAPRGSGRSTYNLRRRMRLAIDGIVSFSNRPLYVSVAFGGLLALATGAYGSYLLVAYAIGFHPGVPGWLSTVVLSGFVGGTILFNLGIVGLYLGRVYDEVKGRPLYVVQSIVRSQPRDQESAP